MLYEVRHDQGGGAPDGHELGRREGAEQDAPKNEAVSAPCSGEELQDKPDSCLLSPRMPVVFVRMTSILSTIG